MMSSQPLPEPYRSTGHQDVFAFAQHVSIAEGLVEMLEPLQKRFEYLLRSQGRERDRIDASTELGSTWAAIWEQLEEARKIAAARGRDLAAYQRARATAGDRWSGAADFNATYARTGFNRYTEDVAYKTPAISAARDAIAALRATMPEVVIPAAPPTPELPRNGLWQLGQVMYYVVMVAAGLLLILVLRRC